MELNRFRFVICLSVALLVMTGMAMAGTVSSATTVNYAREITANNIVYTLPAGSSVVYDMNVIRSVEDDFFIDVTLGNGAFFTGTGIDAADATLTKGGTIGIFSVETTSFPTNTVRFWCQFTAPMTTLGQVTFNTAGWAVRDSGNALQSSGGTISISVATFDAATNDPFDTAGTNSRTFLSNAYGLTVKDLDSTTAVIDVGTNRKEFVVNGDTAFQDLGASLSVGYNQPTWLADGTAFTLAAANKVQLVFAGDMSGIASICYGGSTYCVTPISGTYGIINVALNTATINVPANAGVINNTSQPIVFTVDGTTTLLKRTITLAVNLVGVTGTPGTTQVNSRSLASADTVTVWTLNGTVLLTNWTSGNSTYYNGRIYLFNPSVVDGEVTVDVYPLPTTYDASAPLTPAAGLSLGVLKSKAGINIKVSDIMAALGMNPYTANGGNLVIQLIINAPFVVGYSNVFSNNFSFGTVQLQVIQ